MAKVRGCTAHWYVPFWNKPLQERPAEWRPLRLAIVAGKEAGDGQRSQQQRHYRPANGATRGKQGQPAVTGHAVPPPAASPASRVSR